MANDSASIETKDLIVLQGPLTFIIIAVPSAAEAMFGNQNIQRSIPYHTRPYRTGPEIGKVRDTGTKSSDLDIKFLIFILIYSTDVTQQTPPPPKKKDCSGFTGTEDRESQV